MKCTIINRTAALRCEHRLLSGAGARHGLGARAEAAAYLPPLRPRARWVSISLSWLLSRAVAVPGCCRWEASTSASSEVETASLIAAGSGMVMVC